MLPAAILRLSKALTKIPNIGPKSAEKLALWFASTGLSHSQELGNILLNLSDKIGICTECGYFTDGHSELCLHCADDSRDKSILCLVEQNTNVINIEDSGAYKGRYFVLGGLISPLEGVTISDLPFEKLKNKIAKDNITELIVAFGATTEADVTIMYLKEFLQENNVEISLLGRGIAVGSQLHYVGKKSIAEAFRIREKID